MAFMRVRALLATGLVGLASVASADNLSDVLAAANLNDAQWKATRATFDARAEAVTQGRAGILPSVVLSGEKLSNSVDNSTFGVSGNYDSTQIALTVKQPLFRVDHWYNYQSSRSATSQAEAERVAAEQDFLLRVTDTYFAVLRAHEGRAYARAEEASVSRQLEQAKQRFKVGLIAITDVHETQAAYDLARVGLIVAETDLAVALSTLRTLTGSQYTSLAFPGEDMPVAVPSPEGADAWAEKARAGNPQLIASRFASEAARSQARAATGTMYPSVDLVGQRVSNDSSSFNSTGALVSSSSTSTGIGLQFSWPLYAGGAVNSRRVETAIRAGAAEDTVRATELNAVEGARTQYRVVEADVLRVGARKQAIVSAQSALEATQAGYEVGTRNIVDVLQAQRVAFGARRDFANARYDYVHDLFKLQQAVGGLAPGSLQDASKWLNVTLALDDGAPVVDPNDAVKK